MKETRSTILLTRLAKKVRKETGNHRYRARAEDEERSLSTLLYISCTRPLCMSLFILQITFEPIILQDLLFTEPTVLSISVSLSRCPLRISPPEI